MYASVPWGNLFGFQIPASSFNGHDYHAIWTYFPDILSTLIRNQFQVKPATLLIPNNLFLFLCGVGVLRYPVQE